MTSREERDFYAPDDSEPAAPEERDEIVIDRNPFGNALTDYIMETDSEEPEIAPDESPDVFRVRQLTQALAKAVKSVQLYPPDNPLCRRFGDELWNRINEVFQSMDLIRLAVGKTTLFFAGEPVLAQEGRDESIPGRMFWDGVREVTLHVGIQPDEVSRFLALFRKGMKAPEEGREDDFVTLLWDAKFDHIRYIAIDDILDLENAEDPVPEEFGSDFMNYVDLEMHDLENEEEIERQAEEMTREIRAKILSDDDADLFGITATQREELLEEIAREESPEMLGDIVAIIGETLFLEKDEASFVTLVQVLAESLFGLMGEGRLREAAKVLALLASLAEDRDDLTTGMASALDTTCRAATDDTRRATLVRHLNEGRISAVAALREFVASVAPISLGPVCEAMGGVENPRLRREMSDVLVKKALGNPAPFLPFLEDHRPVLVESAARILGQVGGDNVVPGLARCLRHEDFNVRREALRALSRLGRRRALQVLSESLRDPDPRMRRAAARSLALAGRVAVPPLFTMIESNGFEERDLAEKRAFYEALGYAGGTDVLPLMKSILAKKSFFRRGHVDELKACACEALGWIGGDEAKELLEARLSDRSVLVRTAAQSGLRRITRGADPESLVKEAA